jgi:hypothetical protein
MAVKPQVIRVYKDYYIPLKHRLHPCIKGLVLALLPDLEEESNEHFQSVIELMDDLQASIGSAAVFYKAIFLAVLTSPQQRLAAVNYLLKRFPELQTRRGNYELFMSIKLKTCATDVNSYLGDQDGVDIAINALSAALADSNMLVQRGILDILLGKLPISNE